MIFSWGEQQAPFPVAPKIMINSEHGCLQLELRGAYDQAYSPNTESYQPLNDLPTISSLLLSILIEYLFSLYSH